MSAPADPQTQRAPDACTLASTGMGNSTGETMLPQFREVVAGHQTSRFEFYHGPYWVNVSALGGRRAKALANADG